MNTLNAMNRMERWLPRLPLIIGLAGAAIILMISAGFFDPGVNGDLRWVETDQRLAVPAGSHVVEWLTQELPTGSFSVRLNASAYAGENDIGYGLILKDQQQQFVVSVSPLGYVSIWQDSAAIGRPDPGSTGIIPWQTWPHIAAGTATNEIRIDVESGHAEIRVNRELLWSGAVPGQWQRVGLWAESFGQETVVDFPLIELFSQ